MSIVIEKCNNPRCQYWGEGRCEYDAMGLAAFMNVTRVFDYDHENGRLICTLGKEEETEG